MHLFMYMSLLSKKGETKVRQCIFPRKGLLVSCGRQCSNLDEDVEEKTATQFLQDST